MADNGQPQTTVKATKSGADKAVNVANDFNVEFRPQRYGTGGSECVTTPWGTPAFRTKQEAYRFVGYLLSAVEKLPDEEADHDYATVVDAIKAAS